MQKSFLCYHDFSFNFFCLTVPKNFVGEHFGVSENFGYRKNLCIREGVGITFLRRKLLSQCTEIFHWRTLWCFKKILLSKIFMHRKGASRFCRNLLSDRTETKSFVMEPLCFPENFWYQKKL